MDQARLSVLFDFDGTLGDTEVIAVGVSYCLVAPYLPSVSANSLPSDKAKHAYIVKWAGTPFEVQVAAVEKDREEAGLRSISQVRAMAEEDPGVMKMVNKMRRELGLDPLDDLRDSAFPDILEQCKVETIPALQAAAQHCDGVCQMLDTITEAKFPFCIATTSSKPRVLASIKSCGLTGYLNIEAKKDKGQVHSGESDFCPPRSKPDPSVYMKAALMEGCPPSNCVAVEDSPSGVGSASNVGIGLIVGYVGALHIVDKKEHAKSLLAGARSWNRRGAEIVISNMLDLPVLLHVVAPKANTKNLVLDTDALKKPDALKKLIGQYWLPGDDVPPRTIERNEDEPEVDSSLLQA